LSTFPEAVPASGKVDSFQFPTRVAPERREGWVERAIAVAGVLGTDLIRVFSHLRVVEGLTESFLHDPLLSHALKRAEHAGVRLLLENEPVCTIAYPSPLLEVLRAHEGLGLWLDLGNLHEVGHGTADAVEALAPFAEYVHVKDYGLGEDGWKHFVAAGSGSVPYEELLPVLHRARPVLPYALETHVRVSPVDALAQGAAYLRRTVPGGLA
ncbi:sugar phosphate isomerase/epimerase family protein, partial [Streptomyces corynorhini]